MSENLSQPNIFRKAGAALAATAAMLGATGCSMLDSHMPDCDPGVVIVTLEEAREAYASPDSSIQYGAGEEKNPDRELAEDLNSMDCRDSEGKQAVVRNKAEINGAVFEGTTATAEG